MAAGPDRWPPGLFRFGVRNGEIGSPSVSSNREAGAPLVPSSGTLSPPGKEKGGERGRGEPTVSLGLGGGRSQLDVAGGT